MALLARNFCWRSAELLGTKGIIIYTKMAEVSHGDLELLQAAKVGNYADALKALDTFRADVDAIEVRVIVLYLRDDAHPSFHYCSQ